MKNNNKPSVLKVQINTWEKDSHGLFDYEATKLKKQFFQVQGPCKMFRNWQDAHTTLVPNDRIKRGMLPDQSFSFISSLLVRHNGNCESFWMNTPQQPSQDIIKRDANPDQAGPINTNTYIVVKAYKQSKNYQEGYSLNPGNIVKLGRVQYRVVQMGGFSQKKGQIHSQGGLQLGQFKGVHIAEEQVGGSCKFCLCEDSSADNFLISPCKCKGSCEGVHVQCLKQWIDSKVKKQVTGMVVSYNFTKFECEICKQPFPRMVTRGSFSMQMITIARPQKPYIILQNLNERRESKEERCLHVINCDNGQPVRIGRGHQCQIRLQDISVSRMHSQIRLLNGQFYIQDSNSKFGTLVKLDKTIQLNGKIQLQIGRSKIQFQKCDQQ